MSGEVVKVYDTLNQAARETNSDVAKICLVCRKKRHSHNGYKWDYLLS